MDEWVICGTRNTNQFLQSGVTILQNGGSAIDAVEKVIQQVELNPKDFSVGFNGFPNLLGEVELDASIMDGNTRKAGAVAGIKNYLHPISISRRVLEQSPHVLLIGENAEKFARATGFSKAENMMDGQMKTFYQNIISGKEMLDDIEIPQDITDLAWRYDENIKNKLKDFDYLSWYDKLNTNRHGTVNVIAKDQTGNIVSGVSTSGLALKFPGRAGDSPIIGAGNYADSRYGAATCVGHGELALRLTLARMTVYHLEQGNTLEYATRKSILELINLNENGVIQILAMDKEGNVSASSNQKLHFVVARAKNPVVKLTATLFIEN